ncbi:MAG: FAD-dependent thymidylate synthase [Syntrophorhabdaceae bacterium]|nr:FAD-dependent thymidylate synthase [Syntrophorhabdaceae bacterium]
MEKKLKVMLINYTPNPDEVVALAAKLCYSPSGIDDINKRLSSLEGNDFIKKIIDMGHMSPIEHATFTFAVEGISRACSHQLVRHRLASYSQQSQRYVGMDKGFSYIIPPSIEEEPELKEKYISFMEEIQRFYNYLVENLIRKGRKGESVYEDARFVLPNATETKIILTMNARELLHFFTQRLCLRAQWEIREMALEMLKAVKDVAPKIFSNAGPACIRGRCPEGKYSCGKVERVRDFFKELSSGGENGRTYQDL